jgi:antimicrobial peptide system SdpB family protein
MTRIGTRILDAAASFEPRARWLGLSRSVLAAAVLSVLVFTPDRDLFISAGTESGLRCAGVRAVSLWCLTGPDGFTACRAVAFAVLGLTVAGFRPRWTCLPFWYLTFGLGTAMTVANGGEGVARIIALLLIPLGLADDRTWQWTRPTAAISPELRGAAHVALLFLRLQVLVIYANAAVAKLGDPRWRNGSAFGAVLHDRYYGAPEAVLRFADPVLALPGAAAAAAWLTILAELAIAAAMPAPVAVRRKALWVAVVLHGSIVLGMGLVSFGVVMVAAVALAGTRQPVCGSRSAISPEWETDSKGA